MKIGGRTTGPVLVADADAKARTGLSAALSDAGFSVIEASGGSEALLILQTCVPAIAVIEPYLPGVSGYTVCNQIRLTFGDDLPVVFVSGHRTEACDRVAGLLLGADDYLTQPVAPDELVARIRRLLRRAPIQLEPTPTNGCGRLTAREQQVLTHLAEGLTQKDLAARLFISSKTVGSHVEHILAKLGVKTRAQAVAVAYREGFLRPDNEDESKPALRTQKG